MYIIQITLNKIVILHRIPAVCCFKAAPMCIVNSLVSSILGLLDPIASRCNMPYQWTWIFVSITMRLWNFPHLSYFSFSSVHSNLPYFSRRFGNVIDFCFFAPCIVVYNTNQRNAQFTILIFNFCCLLHVSNLMGSSSGRKFVCSLVCLTCIGMSNLVLLILMQVKHNCAFRWFMLCNETLLLS
jgi:hypothetical protein